MGTRILNPHSGDLFRWLGISGLFVLLLMPATNIEQKTALPVMDMSRIKPKTDSTSLQQANRLVNPKDRASSAVNTKKADSFKSIIQKAAELHRIDSALITAIIKAESGFNPNAVSKRGAKGLMQLMPQTAKSLGVEDCFNPELNIHAGVEYFKKLLNRFDGDVKLALAAYNAGSRKVRQYNGVPPFKETQYYVKAVFDYYEYYKEIRNAL